MATTTTTTTTTTPPPLQTSRTLLTTLLHRLSTIPIPTPPPPQPHPHPQDSPHLHPPPPPLPDSTKPLLLTLHSLLPHCLLPALDLLDRGLVERWTPSSPSSSSSSPPEAAWVYYISSSSSSTTKPSGPSTSSSTTTHETRPYTWSCTCANFCIYAFFDDIVHPHHQSHQPHPTAPPPPHQVPPPPQPAPPPPNPKNWTWGGSTLLTPTPTHIPVCKHLLAAVLIEQCPSLFGKHVRERKGVGRAEMAAAAAGLV
ncbi:hypothetical protein DFH27DRAFT_74611 [Peziza echinospora]|nr:hypothetical protein DFH27DRAFT_74611 [Peziza echinospora]